MGAGDWLQQTWQNWRGEKSSGVLGEKLAEIWLGRNGYKIIARNWRSPRDRRDELDLVCRLGETLVFVEVKSRAAHALVSGYYAVDRRKKKVLRRTIDDYLGFLSPTQRPATIRFDVVEIQTTAGAPPVINHFENISLFGKDYWR